ncbi:MAG: hypothetical protein WAL12_20300, partial [Trebonia sp.]
VVPAGPYRWRCDAARQVENFTDFGHFPWVHPGLLGDPERPVVSSHQVRADGHVLFEDTIFGQDQVVVESQRPERVPFDLAAELHLRFDAVAVAYRKAMRDLGLAASTPIGISVE